MAYSANSRLARCQVVPTKKPPPGTPLRVQYWDGTAADASLALSDTSGNEILAATQRGRVDHSKSFFMSRRLAYETRTAGPMDVHTVRLRQYTPLAPAGLLTSMESWMALRFLTSCSGVNEARPKPTCTLPPLSARYSTLPPLKSFTAAATSVVTVPALGLGMRPRGPSTRPSLATLGIMSGVATSLSKSIMPPAMSSISSSDP
mmetsp:Transcript_7432/g.21997  ORF Transcript_7432/g.21997 Transcript_7432/m.21997 type:complete len:204 (-) Transcript_7432:341-952(-)